MPGFYDQRGCCMYSWSLASYECVCATRPQTRRPLYTTTLYTCSYAWNGYGRILEVPRSYIMHCISSAVGTTSQRNIYAWLRTEINDRKASSLWGFSPLSATCFSLSNTCTLALPRLRCARKQEEQSKRVESGSLSLEQHPLRTQLEHKWALSQREI